VRSKKTENLQHLVLVRHGESEGDVRRAAWNKGGSQAASKPPEREELTPKGIENCRIAGKWIIDNILGNYGLVAFDAYFVSPALRSTQSAMVLGLPNSTWQTEHNLDERNRGLVSGLQPQVHRQLYPRSFEEMRNYPLHWQPPGGEALIPEVANTTQQFINDIKGLRTVIAVTHRDRMWIAQMPLESLTEKQLLATSSDNIHNGEVVHYTSVDPATGESAAKLLWKRSFNPSSSDDSPEWQRISQ
jgi:broad specificity phosphatase PhoE